MATTLALARRAARPAIASAARGCSLCIIAESIGLPGINNLLIAAVIVGLMTYLIMPHYTRLVANWLYR